jgi:hypothetical protein
MRSRVFQGESKCCLTTITRFAAFKENKVTKKSHEEGDPLNAVMELWGRETFGATKAQDQVRRIPGTQYRL